MYSRTIGLSDYLTRGLLDRWTIGQSDYSSDPLEILPVSYLSSPVLLLTLYLYDLPGILFLLKTNRVIVNYTLSLVHVPVCMYIYTFLFVYIYMYCN